MGACPYCRGRVADSAAFCPACGQELPGYERILRSGAEPTTPEFWERVDQLGGPGRRVVLAILAVLFASLPVQVLVGLDGPGILLVDLMLAVAVLACAVPERQAMGALMRRAPLGWMLLGVVFAVLMPLVAELYLNILQGMGLEIHDEGYDMPAWLAIISICIVPGIFEEIACRGLLFGSLLRILNRHKAHVLTAAVFAALHFSPIIFPYHFAVGLLLGWLRDRSGSLPVPILAHAAHNAAVVFLWDS